MKLPKLKLQTKLLLYFLALFLISFLYINFLWLHSLQAIVLKSASDSVASTLQQTTDNINTFLQGKITTLASYSPAINVPQTNPQTNGLQNFLQDSSLDGIALLDRNGKILSSAQRQQSNKSSMELTQAQITTYTKQLTLPTTPLITPLFANATKQPSITIVLPLSLQKTQSVKQAANVKPQETGQDSPAFIAATYHLSDLFQRVTTRKIGMNGYLFLVDATGMIIAHRDQTLVTQHKNVSHVTDVSEFLQGQKTSDAITYIGEVGKIKLASNEFGEESLMQHATIPLTGWGLFGQIPSSEIFSQVNQITVFSVIIFFVMSGFVLLLILWISQQVVRPIKLLEKGANIIGAGNFDYPLTIKSGDEIEELGTSFNTMAANLRDAFHKLSTERNQMAATLASISDAVIAVDAENKIIIFNRAAEQLAGVEEQFALQKTPDVLFSLYSNNAQLTSQRYFPNIKQNGDTESVVFHAEKVKLVSQTNTEKSVNLTTERITDEDNAHLGYLLTLHDVTKEQELEEMKLDFVSMAAHELRTPLTAIRGFLKLLIEDGEDTLREEQKEYLHRADGASDHLLVLVEDILSVTRIERNALNLKILPLDWTHYVQEVSGEFQEKAKEKNIMLTIVKPEGTLPHVLADKVRIGEVLNNLLTNAITYSKPGGMITIRLEQKDQDIVTHVQDTGQGIPEEVIPNLFTKFYRGSWKISQGVKGTGLGLYISKRIVEEHKGKIWVTSIFNQGATFSFTLPIAKDI